jgi:hypothetical protein
MKWDYAAGNQCWVAEAFKDEDSKVTITAHGSHHMDGSGQLGTSWGIRLLIDGHQVKSWADLKTIGPVNPRSLCVQFEAIVSDWWRGVFPEPIS